MNRAQYLLTKVAEEASEVAERALKAAQFGLDDVQAEVNKGDNTIRLLGEYLDLQAVIEVLIVEGMLKLPENYGVYAAAHLCIKKEKIEKYYQYALLKGTVVSSKND